MKFEWDEAKNASNTKKHGISFEEASKVFDDPNRMEFLDQRRDYGEERWKTIGRIFESIISVIFTIRKSTTRIISARSANRKEREDYHNQ
jgi:uncharacterized protein